LPRIPIPLIGPSSKARSLAQQSGRTVNLYPEINDPDAKAVMALHHVPGFLQVIDVSDEFPAGTSVEIRAFHRVWPDRLFFVANERIYEAIDLDDANVTLWASLSTFTGRVGLSDNNGYLVIGDNSYWTLNLADGAGTATLEPVLNDDEEQLLGWFPRWVDGYTIYPHRNSGRFSYSAINDPTTVNGLDFATAEGDPDNINNLIISNRELVFLGGRSTEFWTNTGGDNVFERIGGGFVPHGIAARHSACEFDNSVVFVGRDNAGEGIVWRLGSAGAAPQRISSAAVENAIAGVLQDRLQEGITAFAYSDYGHTFYVLNLPETTGLPNGNRPAQPSQTWVYDALSGLWHERAYRNPATGLFERIKADHHVQWQGKQLVATYDDGAIYWMNLDFYKDNAQPLVKLRESAGPLNINGQRFRVNRLGIEMEVGVGRDGDVQGADPQLMLQFRWGQGAWSNEIWRSIGKIGEGKTLVQFGPLGSGHDLTVRVSVSDPVRVVFGKAWADVEVGR
jgi:hypothetical protein